MVYEARSRFLDPTSGRRSYFGPGDEVPEAVAKLVRPELVVEVETIEAGGEVETIEAGGDGAGTSGSAPVVEVPPDLKTVAQVLTWVEMGEGDEVREARAAAALASEQEGGQRATLLDQLNAILGGEA